MTDYRVYDVFTSEAFGGNPLAVITDARGLAEDQLQRIAREFNFSETTFVFPPEDPAHTARVRIFTPTTEIPFAGHPLIGTATALHDLGRGSELVLEVGVGPIPCAIEEGEARFTTSRPLVVDAHPDLADVAACGGLLAGQIRTDRHLPVQAGLGLPFVLAELTDADALAAISPDAEAFRRGAAAYPAELHFAVLYYVRDGAAVKARMFAPLDNIIEDPATGSAAAALGAYLTQLEGQSLTLLIDQGVEMGRPSRIRVDTEVVDGLCRSVRISGRAVKVMEGRLTL
ncbi:PhzF family phenazine biosynthesis protein [Oceaniglobus roseus]|uniref:PhzF family phenazine biosynthesis protein n=1 Tax=Oceaniglobus roseus TaxID=1737570 RepID=UPI000C7F0A87|nr:PhzF family phenazine biosynthesis protein [Kandeliimicrobium roseum]